MNLKLKDLVVSAVVMAFSFPLIYFVMLLASGSARVEFGPKEKPAEEVKKIEVMKSSVRQDSLAFVNSRAYEALQIERQEVTKERERLADQQQRIDLLQRDLENQKNGIVQDRKKIETLVQKSDSLDMKKIRQLAKVYEAMKPVEAAQILETLDLQLTIKILSAISDDRQKARIMASLPKDKASEISRMMGAPVMAKQVNE